MRYKVPQNIDMPDRILGPLTLLQFVYAVVGGGLAYASYMTLPSPLSVIVAIIVALLTIAIIFLKINERSFSHFILSFFQFMATPRNRVWHHEGSDNLKVEIFKTKGEKNQSNYAHKDVKKEQIERLAQQLDEKK